MCVQVSLQLCVQVSVNNDGCVRLSAPTLVFCLLVSSITMLDCRQTVFKPSVYPCVKFSVRSQEYHFWQLYYMDRLLNHLNSITPSIKFIVELKKEGILPFLDTCIQRGGEGSLDITVYRKLTHTDLYLHFSSHHPRHVKRGLFRYLFDRTSAVSTARTWGNTPGSSSAAPPPTPPDIQSRTRGSHKGQQ